MVEAEIISQYEHLFKNHYFFIFIFLCMRFLKCLWLRVTLCESVMPPFCLGCRWSKATGMNRWGQLGWTSHPSKGPFKQTHLSWGTDAGLPEEALSSHSLYLSGFSETLQADSHHWVVISTNSLVIYCNLESTGLNDWCGDGCLSWALHSFLC